MVLLVVHPEDQEIPLPHHVRKEWMEAMAILLYQVIGLVAAVELHVLVNPVSPVVVEMVVMESQLM